MALLSAAQVADCAAKVAAHLFQGQATPLGGAAAGTATVNWSDVQAGVSQLDADFDATLNAAVTAYGGTTTVINALAASLPAPVSGWTAQQKTVLCCYVLLKRAGLI